MSHSVGSSPKISNKFRLNKKDSNKLSEKNLKLKLEKKSLSKSASELRYRELHGITQDEIDTDAASGMAKEGQSTLHTTASVHPFNVVQKTQTFITSIKDRWSKNWNRDRYFRKHKDQQKDSEDERNDKGKDKKDKYSINVDGYTADNSSDHSSTPQASPYHQPIRKSYQNVCLDEISNEHRQDINSQEFQKGIKVTPWCNEEEDSTFLLCPKEGNNKVTNKEENLQEELSKIRIANLQQFSFFQLKVHLKDGRNLIARDKSGTSDPYVKFKINGKLLYKSKTIYRDLNPIWDECFVIPIEDPFVPLHVKVFDYDWGLQDDFMGSAYLYLTSLDLGQPQDVTLNLEDSRTTEELGEISLNVTLSPKTQEDREQHFQRSQRQTDYSRRFKNQIWSCVVTIVLIKGTNILGRDMDGVGDPYVKFRLGNEKYKSKVAYKSLNPNWLEQFDFHMYDDQSQELEMTVWDKDKTRDDYVGRCVVDLSGLEREKTHKLIKNLEDGDGQITILLTISGTTSSETISDLTTYEECPRERKFLEDRYVLKRTLHNIRDVGHLTVKVYGAQGLAAADLGGKSDPFCVLELVNSRLQTQTEYKTLNPSWQKIFTFNVKDINSVLEVTVYDEDKDHKVEFLGKVAIPLLRIRNDEKRCYALKDKKLRCRAKGNSPQILLEMNVIWNQVRACIRTLNPKEKKYMQGDVKFKRQVFVRNVMRLKEIILCFIEVSKFLQNCFEWESTIQSLIALIVFILLCHYAQPYMVPIALIMLFVKSYIVQKLTGSNAQWHVVEEDNQYVDDEDDDDDKDKEEKKTLKERLQAIQEVSQTVQNSIGHIASLGEAVKNMFNFSVPFLSYLSIGILLSIAFLLYWVSVRYLIMIWGINKFARKIFRPNTIPNNELLDLLSRVPDDEDIISYSEFKSLSTSDADKRARNKRQKTC